MTVFSNHHRLTVAAALLLAVLSILFFSAPARAADDEGGATSGTLLLRSGAKGGYSEAVRLGTDIDATVSGQSMRVRVTQAFRNASRHWAEARYVYPLPEDGAVDTLKMVVGNRIIVGEIKKRAEARQAYEAAKARGVRAGLVEQERANIFTNSVANIGPGETVLIVIEYQAPVRAIGGGYSLRLPLVVAPRYIATGAVPDAARITPPLLDPASHAKINPVSITVRLRPGFPLANVASRYHRIVAADEAGGRIVRLADGDVPADRDFELGWRSAAAAPTLGLFRETVGGRHYLSASLTPPVADRKRAAPPRELIFVIDNSGSMGGESMEQAKASLLYALASLRPGDRFNVIRFDDTMEQLFPDAVAADEAHLRRAWAFVQGLEASGGTEMLPALVAALKDPSPGDDTRIRQVIFLTDGAIGDEGRLLREIGANRGRSRIFMIGIGSAPNSFLMSRAAEIGRGGFTHIGASEEVEARMRALLDRLTAPVATGLSVAFEGVDGELTPALLPDLYEGEPLTVAARVGALAGRMRVGGMVDGKPWSAVVEIGDAVEAAGVSKLWAKRRIDDVEVARSLGNIEQDQADAAIAALGLEHGIVTSQTSLVAIDKTPARPKGARLTLEELPVNLPAGWDFAALFGTDSGEAQPGAAGLPEQLVEMLALPQTATDAELRMLAGLALLLAGLGLALLRRRGRAA